MKPSVIKAGYYAVSLCKNGVPTKVCVHRLVAQAFIPNPDDKPEVDHINRTKTDNRVSNLRWATRVEQQNNRDLSNYANKQRKTFGTPIIEIVDNKQIKYDALNAVPNIYHHALTYHINKGKTDFYAKGRHFILPKDTENSN